VGPKEKLMSSKNCEGEIPDMLKLTNELLPLEMLD
jgi:hypothetical protein